MATYCINDYRAYFLGIIIYRHKAPCKRAANQTGQHRITPDGPDNTKLRTEQHWIPLDGRDNTNHLELENRPAFIGSGGSNPSPSASIGISGELLVSPGEEPLNSLNHICGVFGCTSPGLVFHQSLQVEYLCHLPLGL